MDWKVATELERPEDKGEETLPLLWGKMNNIFQLSYYIHFPETFETLRHLTILFYLTIQNPVIIMIRYF